MPLPTALLERLAKRGLVQKEKSIEFDAKLLLWFKTKIVPFDYEKLRF